MRDIWAIIQARTSSQRLPQKVIKEIEGLPLIVYVIRRVKYSKYGKNICLATTSESEDDILEKIAKEENIGIFRGDKEDVLSRYYFAAKELRVQDIIRITGDCVLIDPYIIDKVTDFYLTSHADYASNIHPPTFPDGLDVEVFSMHCLEHAYKAAKKRYYREHVTPFIWENKEIFKITNYTNNEDLSQMRWIVDEERDFRFVSEIYKKLKPKQIFFMDDILGVLRREHSLADINAGIMRNEGFFKSLSEES